VSNQSVFHAGFLGLPKCSVLISKCSVLIYKPSFSN